MATRKASGTKRPSGGSHVSRWASLLFGGLILLFIGVVIGMQFAGRPSQPQSAAQKPEQRIVVAQPPRVIGRDSPPAVAAAPSPSLVPTAPQMGAPESPAAARTEPPTGVEHKFEAELDRIEVEAARAPQPVVPPIPALPARAATPAPPTQVTVPMAPATLAERVVVPAPPQLTPASLSLPSAGSGWRKFAITPPKTDGKPMVVVVIDDLGVDHKRAERVLALPGPLTTAFMSYARDLPHLTATARARGHELMLHMPMEPMGASLNAGPAEDVLTIGLSPAEIRRRVAVGLGRFDGMIGLNNHMGSRFTSNPAGMKIVMEELAKRGLMFLDSVTTAHSVGVEEARRHGVAALARDVFIDNDETFAAVTAQLHKTEQVARKQGYAIAIGHPHDATIEALTAWLPTVKGKGLVLVPISAILRRQHPSG